jgi:hypothetical protein
MSLRREESFMYDREPKFPLHAADNSVRLEYTLRGLTHVESRRGRLIRISRSCAMIELQTGSAVAAEVNLQIPDARLDKIGCVKTVEKRGTINPDMVIVTLRFLRTLSDKEVQRVLDQSIGAKEAARRMPNIVMAN